MKKTLVMSVATLAGLAATAPTALAWTKKEQKVFDQSGYTLCDARMFALGDTVVQTDNQGKPDLAATLKELGNRKALISAVADKLMDTAGKYQEDYKKTVDEYISTGRKDFYTGFPTPTDAKYADFGGPELEFCPPEETYTAKDIELIADVMNTDDLAEARAWMSSKLIAGERYAIDSDLKRAKDE